jgi:hypothetical protein
MRRSIFTILILGLGTSILFGQCQQNGYLLKKLNIIKIESYYFEPNQANDSLLMSVEEFNHEGLNKIPMIRKA